MLRPLKPAATKWPMLNKCLSDGLCSFEFRFDSLTFEILHRCGSLKSLGILWNRLEWFECTSVGSLTKHPDGNFQRQRANSEPPNFRGTARVFIFVIRTTFLPGKIRTNSIVKFD